MKANITDKDIDAIRVAAGPRGDAVIKIIKSCEVKTKPRKAS